MNLLLSDTSLPEGLPVSGENIYIDLSELKIQSCTGCFGCWTKTPGKCVIRDDGTKVYPLIAKSERVIYVSRLFCGSYDVPMKTMLERSLPVQQAFLRLYNKETHHVQRSVEEKEAVIIAYGNIPAEEQEIFRSFIERNASNMCFRSWRICFAAKEELGEAVRREVNGWESLKDPHTGKGRE